MTKENSDLKRGLQVLAAGFLVGFVSRELAFVIYIAALFYYGVTGISMLVSEAGSRGESPRSANRFAPSRATAPTPSSPTISDRIEAENAKGEFKCPSCGATVSPTDKKCKFCGSVLVASQTADIPRPAKWSDVEIGQTIHVSHPQGDKISSSVVQRVYYGELWQERMTRDTPWTLTGNYFVGLHLKNGMYLLNWQERFYLLDSHFALTDQDINRDFASPARQFSSSNQTAQVHFDYRGTKWKMDDIGRFRIELADGEDQKLKAGAVGRFIHASQGKLVLVVEDFQSGGRGLDTARTGYRIEENNVQF